MWKEHVENPDLHKLVQQNNDKIQISRKIQFHRSFNKISTEPKKCNKNQMNTFAMGVSNIKTLNYKEMKKIFEYV